jgi:hypothetical protein
MRSPGAGRGKGAASPSRRAAVGARFRGFKGALAMGASRAGLAPPSRLFRAAVATRYTRGAGLTTRSQRARGRTQ